ncbi:MAG: phage major capsid protein [Actinomycetia bacterium]|nr:phage major capsid protein [Actinomycetes bacterium]
MTTPSGSYDQIIARGTGYGGVPEGQGDNLVPEPLATSIIQEAPKSSAALTLCRRTTLSAKTERLPVLDVLPFAYWVGGDTGLKQTSQQAWKNVVLVVEELACIIPIPQAYLDDAAVPLWSEVQPRMTEAAGQLIDQAVFFGVNKPSTWGEAIIPGALAAGNDVETGTGADFGVDVASLGETMALTGYTVNGFAGRPGLNWMLAGLRSDQGIPIYSSINTDMSSDDALNGALYGFPISLIDNGAWDPEVAQLVAGDFTKAIIGIRQDITFKLFTEGVVSDDSGAVVLNLMQQDAVAMRMVMRVAYAVANPVTLIGRDKAIGDRFPFGVVTPAGEGAARGAGAHEASAPAATRATTTATSSGSDASSSGTAGTTTSKRTRRDG